MHELFKHIGLMLY